MRQIEKILNEIAQENDLAFQSLADGWILKVGAHFVTGYHFDLNNTASDRLCDDKSATYEYLQKTGIPAVPHYFFMPENTEKKLSFPQIEQLKAMLKERKELVLKPNQGSGGTQVRRTTKEKELLNFAADFALNAPFLAVSPYFDIEQEYRVIMLNQEVQLIYAKQIQEPTQWKHNLGQGAKPQIIEPSAEIYQSLSQLAQMTAKALNINFASIDIVEIAGKLSILEVNSGVMMEYFSAENTGNYQTAKRIYQKAIIN